MTLDSRKNTKLVVAHIAAMAENRVIGRSGGMPWHIPEDFKFFKETTMGHAMIMGRKTWDSIGRVLPGRITILVTKNARFKAPDGALVTSSISAAIALCDAKKDEWGHECFIVGGGEIYKESLPIIDRIYLTLVHQKVDGDTYYPEFSTTEFRQIKNEPHLEGAVPFTFTIWDRIPVQKSLVRTS